MIASPAPDAVGGFVASRCALSGPSRPEPLSRALAAGLAHNVNNPLLGIIGSLELALRETDSGTALRERLQRSLACALFAAEAVRRMVAYAFHPTGRRAAVSLREAAARAARRLHDQGYGQGLLIRLEGDSANRARVSEPLLELVLAQLLANARDAMPERGTVTLQVWEKPGLRGLSIRDDGPGLSASARARLFKPFFTTKGAGHLGLGLVLCRDLIESQGGRLDILSPPGQGVRVTLALPAAEAESLLAARPLKLGPPHCTADRLMLRVQMCRSLSEPGA